MPNAFVTRAATFLPNESISNQEMEQYLGYIHEKPSKTRAIVLRNNRIRERYYALTRDGVVTHTNAQMASLAIRQLFQGSGSELRAMDLLACGTSSPDQLMPSHAVMVHGWLPETDNIEVVSAAGVCCSGMHAFKYATQAVRLGDKRRAVACASERLSTVLRAEHFEEEVKHTIALENNPYLAFEKDFLRWMLSDGAGAVLVEPEPAASGPSLRVEWIQGVSYANQVEPCMFMGAVKLPDGSLKSYKDHSPGELSEKSVFAIKQDVRLLSEKIVKLGFDKLKEIMTGRELAATDVDHFLPHMSSHFFENKMDEYMHEIGIPIPKERWFTNLATKGNVGAASIYLMLADLMGSGRLRAGEKILLAVPESGRFSYVYALLTVV